MCVLGSAFYHCHNWREQFVFTISHAPAVLRDTTGVCAMCSVLIMDVIILFSRQTRVYMLLSEGLLILGIFGQTWPEATPQLPTIPSSFYSADHRI